MSINKERLKEVIRLAYDKPEFRPTLMPAIKAGLKEAQKKKDMKANVDDETMKILGKAQKQLENVVDTLDRYFDRMSQKGRENFDRTEEDMHDSMTDIYSDLDGLLRTFKDDVMRKGMMHMSSNKTSFQDQLKKAVHENPELKKHLVD